ncbi:MAG: KTSC domain-containing protein [Synergistaceae bacterium]|nr:KTSC domain-containing protein [Synergistaceae bacterium]MBR0233224.1 KTSC domain-containing protein [Synergistaceae bacterium]MBR0315838.1 KTSC domain-containing protein [Synergistaceae bacterium]
MLERIPVKSSDLKSVGYDSEKRLLEVEFLNKSIYQYSRVPQTVYNELMNANHKGEYFSRYIRDNQNFSCCQTYPKYSLLRG